MQLFEQLLGSRAIHQHPYRDRILDAAESEIVKHGVKRASIGDIAQMAGVSRPTLYRACGDKNGIVAGVVERAGFAFLKGLAARLEGVDSPEERAVIAFVEGVRVAQTNPILSAIREFEPDVATRFLVVDDHGLAPVNATISLILTDAGLDLAIATRATDLMIRIIVSLLIRPSALFPLDTDEQAADFARTYLLPLLSAEM